MKASEVQVGAKIWKHGYQWEVLRVISDPRGNASMHDAPMPRIVLSVRNLAIADVPALPLAYHQIELGYLPDAEVTTA